MKKTVFSLVACATLVASSQASTHELDPIVISATKTEQSLNEVTANKDIITAEELEERHITSVLDALRSFTSIPITQSGGIGQQSSFYQRGFKTENTVVMVDGVRYNDPTTIGGLAQLQHLMINDIERIEVIYGPQSGVWGANAAAGVINIITKKASQKMQANANIEYGSYATTKIGANLSQKSGNFSYYLGANQLRTNGFSAQVPPHKNPDQYEDDGYTNQTFNIKLGYDLTAQDSIIGQLNFIDAKADYDDLYDPNSSANEIHQINRIGSIQYRHNIDSKSFVNVSYAITAFNKKDPLGPTSEFKGTNKELTILGTFYYQDNDFITAGVAKSDSKDLIGSHELNSKAIFLTNSNRFNNLILTESLRHDQYDEFNNKTTGKIGAKYFFENDLSISANYGTAYRVPSLYELYSPSITYQYPVGVWNTILIGNSALTPETTKGYDATVEYKNLSFTYFNNTITNLIDFTSGYNNVEGKSTFKGYELSYKGIYDNILEYSFSYNKLFAKNKNGQYYNRRPYDSTQASVSYYPTSSFSIGTAANYVGTRYNDLAQTTQTGRYTLWSAFANYALNSNITIYLKGENLTDKLYQEITGYGTAGRTIFAGMNAKF